ncbi:putative GNAT family N-acyltransferase [Acidovorax soli]|uniref:Putative GNAT family N-acyltransferase n=1 Tax=Acidovorax soli TaxID=592050 RepID=A0A7X0U9K2_9BURK|nr:GNAT family N-acetyltransferase [Acidovorax soli]MBB6560251.1 putative GNAT family N-acyltransferase [Acidovorax soli]
MPGCLEIFDSNTPPFFDPSERAYFVKFLEENPCPYFVLEQAQAVVACGGYCEDAQGGMLLVWGMVRRDLHRQGLGKDLVHQRVQRILQAHPGAPIRLETSQHTQDFYGLLGFRAVARTQDYYGPGLHRVDMVLTPG